MKNTFFGIIAFVKKPWLFKEIVKIQNSRLGIRDAMWRVGTLPAEMFGGSDVWL